MMNFRVLFESVTVYIRAIVFTVSAFILHPLVLAENMEKSDLVTLFMTGDVMTGRGIDQVLPHSVNPQLYEPYVKDARDYVVLAEKTNGRINKPVSCSWIWGDMPAVLERVRPDLRIINLETSITTSEDHWPRKGIHYRMHPANINCLQEAGIDYVSLANNHVMDWGYEGLVETLNTLERGNIRFAGAGTNRKQAEAPAIMKIPGKGRVIIFSYGLESSGVPTSWAATENRPGVNYLEDLSDNSVRFIRSGVEAVKEDRDIVLVSIHWGSNWGYDIPEEHVAFARKLIDEAHVDLIHGHSSHHPRGIEIYKGKLVLYGAGDFLNDYEGIGGHREYRGDLALMYFADIDPASDEIRQLQITPVQIRQFSLQLVSNRDAELMRNMLEMASERFGTGFVIGPANTLVLEPVSR